MRMEINEISKRKQRKRNEAKSWFTEKINKLNKVDRLIRGEKKGSISLFLHLGL